MIYTTFPDEVKAAEVAESLVRGGLVACANILPGARSIYLWQGRLERESEAVAIMKTPSARCPEAMAALRQRHPYETPAILVYPVVAGAAEYLAWIQAQTRPESPPDASAKPGA